MKMRIGFIYLRWMQEAGHIHSESLFNPKTRHIFILGRFRESCTGFVAIKNKDRGNGHIKRIMGTLYIDRKELLLKLDGQAIAFYSNNVREGIVPINPLKRVIIVGNVLLETSVLNKLASEGKSVLFLSGKRLSYRGILHGRLHSNGSLRVKQYEKSLTSFNKEIAVYLIRKKLTSCH